MSHPCAAPLPFADLIDYFAGDLEPATEDALESHLLGCAACTAAASDVQAFVAGLHTMLPPVITASGARRLRDAGARLRETEIAPGGDVVVEFDREVDFLIHVLQADLADAEQVDVQLLAAGGDATLRYHERVAFEAGEGSIRIACQRHYRALGFPDDLCFRVSAVRQGERRKLGDYVVRHRWLDAP